MTTPVNSPRYTAARGQNCPCGSGRLFENCCEPVLKGERLAATAEELMRARFTAHAVNDYAFLHHSYLTTSRQPFVPETEDGSLNWNRLVIHSHEPDIKPGVSHVDFSAYHTEDGVEEALHEKSEFNKIDGRWFYTRTLRHGPAPIKAVAAKVGRNDPCPCGSGKKYKQCCLR